MLEEVHPRKLTAHGGALRPIYPGPLRAGRSNADADPLGIGRPVDEAGPVGSGMAAVMTDHRRCPAQNVASTKPSLRFMAITPVFAGWWNVRTVVAARSLAKASPRVFMAIAMPRPR